MNFRQIGVVFRKEFVEAVRDRRTLITSILVPILLFPVTLLGMYSPFAIRLMLRNAVEYPNMASSGASASGPAARTPT